MRAHRTERMADFDQPTDKETEMTRQACHTSQLCQADHLDQIAAPETEAKLMRSAISGALTRREMIRRGRRTGLGLAAIAALAIARRDADAKGTAIPPNCIRVCCDGTCDSWKMCWKCVQWPKPPTKTAFTEAP